MGWKLYEVKFANGKKITVSARSISEIEEAVQRHITRTYPAMVHVTSAEKREGKVTFMDYKKLKFTYKETD